MPTALSSNTAIPCCEVFVVGSIVNGRLLLAHDRTIPVQVKRSARARRMRLTLSREGENSFRQLRLNQWVKQAVRWMPMEKWDTCNFAVDEDELEGRVCYGGLDLSSTTDLTAFALVFPPVESFWPKLFWQ